MNGVAQILRDEEVEIFLSFVFSRRNAEDNSIHRLFDRRYQDVCVVHNVVCGDAAAHALCGRLILRNVHGPNSVFECP